MVSLETKKYNSRKQEKCQHYQPVKLIKINVTHEEILNFDISRMI